MDAHTLLPLAVPPLSLLQTLERSYLLRLHGKVVERPQHMLMRVAIGIHLDDIEEAVKTYHLLRCAAVAGVPCCQRQHLWLQGRGWCALLVLRCEDWQRCTAPGGGALMGFEC